MMTKNLKRKRWYPSAGQLKAAGKLLQRYGPGVYKRVKKWTSSKKKKPAAAKFSAASNASGPGTFKQRKWKGKKVRLRKHESLGPEMTRRSSFANVLHVDENVVDYTGFVSGTRTEMKILLNNFLIVGEDTGGTERIETIKREDYQGFGRIKVNRITKVLKFRNNSKFPVDMWFYWVQPKIRTGVTPEASMAAGFDDQAGSNDGWELQPMFFPGMSQTFRKRYAVLKQKKLRLYTGDDTEQVLSYGPFVYDDDWEDDTSDKNITPYRSRFLLVRIRGVVAHDDTTHALVGYGSGDVDYIAEETVKYQHISSTNIARSLYAPAYDTFASAAVIGQSDTVVVDEKQAS